MKTLKSIAVATLLSSVLFISCKDDEESKSAVDLLTGGSSKSWKIESRSTNNVNQPLDSCEADDFLTFTKSGNILTVNPGNITCNEKAVSGTWRLSNGDKVLNLTDDKGSTSTSDINELSDHKFIIKTSFTDTTGSTPKVFTTIVTLAHLK